MTTHDAPQAAVTDTARRPHVVIVGGGFGGLNAARALAEAPVEVTIVDRRNHHLFQPLLYQVATASLSPADIASPIRSITRKQKNLKVMLAEARAVDVARREVVLEENERLPYDYLILAAGARRSAYFGHDEWEQYAPGLKTLDDAIAIRRRILLSFEEAERTEDEETRRRLLTFVVVGGGPTGVELAGAIGEIARYSLARDFDTIDPRSARIELLEGGPRLLPAFPEKLAKKADRFLRELGVTVRTGAMVTAVEPDGVRLGEERIAANTMIWAAGVTAASIGKTLGVEVDRAGRVPVQPDLTIPGHPEVFVVGDLAAFPGPDGKPLPGLAPVAIQQGRHAAANVRRALRGEPVEPFRYKDRGALATIGRNRAIADLGPVKLSGFIAWLAWLLIHIVQLIGFRNRAVVMTHWIWSYLTFQRGARLITGPGPADEAM